MKSFFIVFAACGVLFSIGGIVYSLFYGRRESNLGSLLSASRGFENPQATRETLEGDLSGKEYERLKRIQKSRFRKQKKEGLSIEERYFHAGIFSRRAQKEFERLRILLPAILGPLGAFVGWSALGTGEFALYGGVIGVLFGIVAPSSILDRKIKRRGEDILYYLPLVIEQIAIGVSSSLDIGPCLQRVVSMADERDSHNVVTELIRHSQLLVKSGISLEDSMIEVGTRSGHNELKHSFMALSQVAKHGGELSRQLMELADAVAQQREAKIEEKIRKLELEATAPVALVFVGFFIILIVGFGIQIKQAFV